MEFAELTLDERKEDIVLGTVKFSRLDSDIEAHTLLLFPGWTLNVVINNSGIVSS